MRSISRIANLRYISNEQTKLEQSYDCKSSLGKIPHNLNENVQAVLEKILKAINTVLLGHYYLTMDKGRVYHLNTVVCPLSWNTLCQILEKN